MARLRYHTACVGRRKTFLLLLFIALSATAYGQLISTICGTGTGAYNGDGIAATTAQLRGPQGLAIDVAGNIFIADLENNRIRKIDQASGIITTIAGTGTAGYNGDGIAATSAQLSYPSALAFDASGDLYCTDRNNHRIRKITMSTGIISTVAGTDTNGYNSDDIAATSAHLSNPNDVVISPDGDLYIADWINNRVRKVETSTGIITTVLGTGTAGYNGDGIAATSAQITQPCGVIFDAAANMYVAEYFGHRVRKVSASTGLVSTIAGNGAGGYNGDGIPATTAQVYLCAYIRFDGNENMYIGDAANQRIRKIDAGTGLISTIAGTGTVGYNGDGIAPTAAQLNYAFNIVFDAAGNAYLADYYNHRIRKITGLPNTGLPLTLLSFTLRQFATSVQVDWSVPAENIQSFSVERSADGFSFEEIATGIQASGNIYRYVDPTPFSGTNYYRLKTYGSEGAWLYSEIKNISVHSTANTPIVFPNPVLRPADVSFHTTTGSCIVVTDLTGNVLWEKKDARILETIGTGMLSPGMYLYCIIPEGGNPVNGRLVVSD